MRRFVAALGIFATWVLLAAQSPVLPGFPPGVFLSRGAIDGTAPAYVGAGDKVTFNFPWWGLVPYTAASNGVNIADITDSATGNTTGTRLQSSTGGNVVSLVSGSACTFVTGNACSDISVTCATACNIRTIYDQSGLTDCTTACDVTQATNASRPIFVQNCVNSRPCMSSTGTQVLISPNTSVASGAQPISSSSVSSWAGTTGTYVMFAGSSGPQNFYAVTSNIALYAGTQANIAITLNAWNALQAVFNGVNCVAYLNSVRTSGLSCNNGVTAIGSQLKLGANVAGGTTTKWTMGGWFLGGFTNQQQSDLDTVARTIYGF